MKLLRVIWFLAAVTLVAACEREPVLSEATLMDISIEMPGPLDIKADVGEIPSAYEAEYKLHSLKIWAFNSEDHTLISYLNLSESQFPAPGRTRNYSVPVLRSFAKADPRPNVDVFAIANESAIGITTFTQNTSWETLHDAAFGDPYFGIDPLTAAPVSEETGLPMSALGLDMPVLGDDPVLKLNPVKLTRLVSKMRFVFCRMEDENEQDQLAVTGITLNGQQFPVSEHVFTLGKYDIVTADGYVQDPFSIPGPATLASNATPEKLTWAGQDAMSYEALINNAVEAGILSDAGTLYLRESNKLLQGYVTYTVNGGEYTRKFTMAAAGDFARNHSWIMYGYFLSGRNLQLSVNVMPWDYNEYEVNFEDHLQIGRFIMDLTTVEQTIPQKDHFDEHLLSGVTAKGSVNVTAPRGGKLYIEPVGDAWAFEVTPDVCDINPAVNGGNIEISIRRNPLAEGDLTGKSISLSFTVEVGNRVIYADDEVFNGDVYRFIL